MRSPSSGRAASMTGAAWRPRWRWAPRACGWARGSSLRGKRSRRPLPRGDPGGQGRGYHPHPLLLRQADAGEKNPTSTTGRAGRATSRAFRCRLWSRSRTRRWAASAAGREPGPRQVVLAMGQSAGGVHDVLPAAEIVRRIMAEANESISRMSRLRRRTAAGWRRNSLTAGRGSRIPGQAVYTDITDEELETLLADFDLAGRWPSRASPRGCQLQLPAGDGAGPLLPDGLRAADRRG